ncbi:TetR/AcrR family transcriptional regulator [Paremcibacter congregatus]|uniref:TetR family transcriptional regulator n=1 Tax=Paremcibacter congregatus TaxID=2043170 RepID=A0A2G4YTS1_9PROT|nr:TetR family transcriptional regulator [Paremcibacter congregatus]PHZ85732.1 TetR family transcriptional regulator [Paremcibacter congregatus]QDE26696.1 TetR family transcriptional regulator [Paremcibacter congregatus]
MRPSKRDELVQKALEVFYQNGFHATGMDMLVAETGISKTSMYKHFRTKEDLILATLRLRDEQFRNWLFRRMEELGATPRSQLIAMFDALKEWFAQDAFRGCMFIKASSEYQEENDPIYKQSAEHKRLLYSYICDLAKKAGAPRPEALARSLLLLKEGAIVTAHLRHTANPAMDAKAAAKTLLAEALGQ